MIDNTSWKQIFSGYVDRLNNTTQGKPYLTFLYNLAQQTQVNVVQGDLKRGVDTMYLVKGTSQYAQPCYKSPIGTLRKEMNKTCTTRMPNAKGESLNHLIKDIVPAAIEKAFTSNCIKTAFRVTGLYPFDQNVLMQRCLENLGVLSTDTTRLAAVDERALQFMQTIHRDTSEEKINRKILKAQVKLNYAYRSGHVIQGHEEEFKRKEEEVQRNKL